MNKESILDYRLELDEPQLLFPDGKFFFLYFSKDSTDFYRDLKGLSIVYDNRDYVITMTGRITELKNEYRIHVFGKYK